MKTGNFKSNLMCFSSHNCGVRTNQAQFTGIFDSGLPFSSAIAVETKVMLVH